MEPRDDLLQRMEENNAAIRALLAAQPPLGDLQPLIWLPVPPEVRAAWYALPAAHRDALAQAIVESWLTVLTRPREEPDPIPLVPYYSLPEAHELPALSSRSDEDLVRLMHEAERVLASRYPNPPLTVNTAPLFESDREQPQTNAALYVHDFYRWCAQTAHLARSGGLGAVAPLTLASGMDDAMHHQWEGLEHLLPALLGWLLVWAYAPERREAHAWWYTRITSLRTDLAILLSRSPVLRARLMQDREAAYRRAREVAADDLGWGDDASRLPVACPWTVEQILDDAFWPQAL